MTVIISFSNIILADAGDGFNASVVPNFSSANSKIKTVGNRIASTAFTVLQILAFAGIIVAGIKYMYSSADQRADIKKSLVYVVSGMVLVFGASTVAKFAQKSFKSVYDSGQELVEGVKSGDYTYVAMDTKDKCYGETITKRVYMNKGGNYYYCSDSGSCCSLVNGKYEFVTTNTALSDSKIKKAETAKSISKEIYLPKIDNYYHTSESNGCVEWANSDENDKVKYNVTITVNGDNTGTITINGIRTDNDIQHTFHDGNIYIIYSTCGGGNHEKLVYDSKGALLYKNIQ